MMAGTFNLVIAERLARKICHHCKSETCVKGTDKHRFAIESFKNILAEALKKEIISRKISQEQWDAFVND